MVSVNEWRGNHYPSEYTQMGWLFVQMSEAYKFFVSERILAELPFCAQKRKVLASTFGGLSELNRWLFIPIFNDLYN